MMTTKRGSKKSSRGGKSARAPGLLSALQDDRRGNLFCLYFVTRFIAFKKQRTNGPVNAHLRSAVYTNVIENSPSIGADEALGPFFSE